MADKAGTVAAYCPQRRQGPGFNYANFVRNTPFFRFSSAGKTFAAKINGSGESQYLIVFGCFYGKRVFAASLQG
jgi:hypothetical protein